MKVASCSIVRLENSYIREFVEHQKNIGFDKVFIYDHNLPDGERLDEVIYDYIQSGFVAVIDFREGHKMGPAVMEAFQHCWDNYHEDFDWILFCDNDEFLTFTQDKNVKEYLNRDNISTANIIKINWLCYDDNDLLYYENKPLNERFTRLCCYDTDNPYGFIENLHIKSFINCKTKNVDWINGCAHSPKIFNRNKFLLYDKIINGVGEICKAEDQSKLSKIFNPNFDLVYLKHFRMKTIEEYVTNKINKLSKYGYSNVYFDDKLFFKYNKKSVKKMVLYKKLINNQNLDMAGFYRNFVNNYLNNKKNNNYKNVIVHYINNSHEYLDNWISKNSDYLFDFILIEDNLSESHYEICKKYDNVSLIKINEFLNNERLEKINNGVSKDYLILEQFLENAMFCGYDYDFLLYVGYNGYIIPTNDCNINQLSKKLDKKHNHFCMFKNHYTVINDKSILYNTSKETNKQLSELYIETAFTSNDNIIYINLAYSNVIYDMLLNIDNLYFNSEYMINPNFYIKSYYMDSIYKFMDKLKNKENEISLEDFIKIYPSYQTEIMEYYNKHILNNLM
jgi:hypothetical protein